MGTPSLNLPDAQIESLDILAHWRSTPERSVSRSGLVREAIEAYLDEHSGELDMARQHHAQRSNGTDAENVRTA